MSNKTDNAAKHTHGPWFRRTDDGEILIVSDDVFVAHVKHERNAALIAAAPCLLAACEGALPILESEGYFGGIVDQLRTAIARAKGGQ